MLVVACAATAPDESATPAAGGRDAAPTAAPPAPTTRDSPAAPPCTAPCRSAPTTVGTFDLAVAPEASGLASSRRHPGLLYVVDDGPGTSELVVLDAATAEVVGRLEIAGLDGVDTEDLAAGPCGVAGGRCLYVADIGDNVTARDSIAVHRITEPARARGRRRVDATVATLRYPDGPHDAETLMIDATGRLGIVTKDAGARGRGAARLYTVERFADQTLVDRGRLRLPLPSVPLAGAVVGHVITGGDWAPGRAVVRTYDALYELTAPPGSDGLDGLPAWDATEVPVAAEPQGGRRLRCRRLRPVHGERGIRRALGVLLPVSAAGGLPTTAPRVWPQSVPAAPSPQAAAPAACEPP